MLLYKKRPKGGRNEREQGENLPSMTLGQLPSLASLLDGKPPRPIRTLQILEPVDGNSRSASRELQQSALLLGIPTSNALPKVLNDFVVFGVPTIVSMLLPIVNVNVGDTTNQEFQFSLVKDVHEINGDELVEA